jgi:hypothetical protein
MGAGVDALIDDAMSDPIEASSSSSTASSTPRLPPRQRVVLDWIVQFITVKGYAPTMREIGNGVGISSTNGVNDHLRALERKGYITRSSDKNAFARARSIVVVRGPTVGFVDARIVQDTWHAEIDAYRRLLHRIAAAGARCHGLSAEMIIVLGDVRDVLRTMPGGGT